MSPPVLSVIKMVRGSRTRPSTSLFRSVFIFYSNSLSFSPRLGEGLALAVCIFLFSSYFYSHAHAFTPILPNTHSHVYMCVSAFFVHTMYRIYLCTHVQIDREIDINGLHYISFTIEY